MKYPSQAPRLLTLLITLILSSCARDALLPARAIELNNQGAEALARGDLDTAASRLDIALEYHPKFVEALTNLALVELERGELERAETHLLRALRVNSDIAQPHHGLGVLAERQGDLDRSARHYRAALKVDPGFLPARLNLARLYFNTQKFNHARIQFKRAVELDGHEPLAHAGLIESLLALKRNREADARLEGALAVFEGSPEFRLLSARRLLRHQKPAQAIEQFLQVVNLHPAYAERAYAWIAAAELSLGRPHHALGAARKALDLHPDQPLATYIVALSLSQLGAENADSWLEKARHLNPNHALIHKVINNTNHPHK